MADEEKVEAEEAQPEVEEPPHPPDPGPPATSPTPPEPTEEELEQAAKEKEEAEQAALDAAADQPEDSSVEEKERNPVLVLKEQFEAEWPAVEHQFPGVEPEFGKEAKGYVELLNIQAPSMAYATNCEPPVLVLGKPERSQHGWEDFLDNSLPASEAEEGDIEAAPKKRQTKAKANA